MLSQDILLASLRKYYTQENKIDHIVDIIKGNSKISLRLIDWYVTNYCKMNNIVILNPENSEYFNVYMNYRAQLKAFKKVQFDPFRRRDRIVLSYGDSEKLHTTIGQLNFFRWALENKIIDNIRENLASIEREMMFTHNAISSKDRPISAEDPSVKSSIKNMTTYTGSTLISFE
jgi:hypothetical protein